MSPFEVVINGWPIIPIILGLVELVKRLGLKGNVLIIVSMLLGLLMGAGNFIATSGIPAAFAGWFALVVGGLGYGLVASGIYDVVQAKRTATSAGPVSEDGRQ